jgi:hypothetical protein
LAVAVGVRLSLRLITVARAALVDKVVAAVEVAVAV